MYCITPCIVLVLWSFRLKVIDIAIDKNTLDLKKEDSSFIFLRMKDINSIDNCTSTALVETIKDIW